MLKSQIQIFISIDSLRINAIYWFYIMVELLWL